MGGTFAISQNEPSIPDLIKDALRNALNNTLSTDELVSQVKAKGSKATRETILGAAYRMAKPENAAVKNIGKGIFSLASYAGGSTISTEDNGGQRMHAVNQ